MKFLPKEAWHYAILLIILFAIAALAVSSTLSYIGHFASGKEHSIVTLLMWATTMGFMLIAGAFGLWAIRFSATAESIRRVSQIVDTMDYLSDGLIAVDDKGRITGANPTARSMMKLNQPARKSLMSVFPCLSEDDMLLLMNRSGPEEIERDWAIYDASRILRFRSQPSEDITIILVSDVTAMNALRLHNRQSAHLQLIGQIARGVAHDFNNILCVIAGHTALLTRLPPGSDELKKSIAAIADGTERGTSLANHLLELAKPHIAGKFTTVCHEHIQNAAQTLRDTLPSQWHIETNTPALPPIALTGIQVEQVVLNLGILATDTAIRPGTLRITAGLPDSTKPMFDVPEKYAAVILISSSAISPHESVNLVDHDTSAEAGVILSVIESMLQESGGLLQRLSDNKESLIYRACLPRGIDISNIDDDLQLSDEIESYIKDWSIMIARPSRNENPTDRRIKKLAGKVEYIDNIIPALAYIEQNSKLDAIVIQDTLIAQETEGLLKAMLRLKPDAGYVVMTDNPGKLSETFADDIVFAPIDAKPNTLILSLIESRNLAGQRERKSRHSS